MNASQSKGPEEARKEQAILNVLEQQMNAWNKGDAKLYSQTFAEDTTCTNILGVNYVTRDAIELRTAGILGTVFKGSTLKLRVRRLKFIRPEVALVDIDSEATGHRAELLGVKCSNGVLRTNMLQVLKEEKGHWQVVAFHNTVVTTDGLRAVTLQPTIR